VHTATAESQKNSERNKLSKSDREFHDWYRFVLSFPPHLVRKYIYEFGLKRDDVLLDPFCGTGTTLIEAKLLNIPSIGIEANNFAHFASSVKTNWEVDPTALMALARQIRNSALSKLRRQGISDDPASQKNIIILYLTKNYRPTNSKHIKQELIEQGQKAARIQMRRGGSDWTTSDDPTNSPFVDGTPSTGGNPEKREYRAIYLKDNKPFGQYSDIVTVFTTP